MLTRLKALRQQKTRITNNAEVRDWDPHSHSWKRGILSKFLSEEGAEVNPCRRVIYFYHLLQLQTSIRTFIRSAWTWTLAEMCLKEWSFFFSLYFIFRSANRIVCYKHEKWDHSSSHEITITRGGNVWEEYLLIKSNQTKPNQLETNN